MQIRRYRISNFEMLKGKKIFELRIFLFRKTILAREMAWQTKVLITKLVNLSSFPKTQW